jgi:hypothetical protein
MKAPETKREKLLASQKVKKRAKNVPCYRIKPPDNLKTGSFFTVKRGARDGKSGMEMSALALWRKSLIKIDN